MKAVVLKSETSWPVAMLWVSLSTVVATTSLFCLTQPSWFINEPELRTRTGMPRNKENVKISALPPNTKLTMEAVQEVLVVHNEVTSSGIGPIVYCRGTVCRMWSSTRLSTILYGGGGAILGITCISAAIVLFIKDKIWRHKAMDWIGYLQVAAG